MTELSPQALAVKQAAEKAYWLWDQMCPADADTIAAATIRAVADRVEVIPLYRNPVDAATHHAQLRIKNQLFSIANELEQIHSPSTNK